MSIILRSFLTSNSSFLTLKSLFLTSHLSFNLSLLTPNLLCLTLNESLFSVYTAGNGRCFSVQFVFAVEMIRTPRTENRKNKIDIIFSLFRSLRVLSATST
eukprot:GHVP01018155.1.p1 GENE.GHVP01018155.1~~GHVP01018155.1.p1  ORF type:complete len:101 (-),score=13.16 GHVP01018155.1:176-478(-)